MDMGVWFLQQAAHERFGEYCSSVATFVKAAKGTFSGGTLASMANMIEQSRKDRHFARILVSLAGGFNVSVALLQCTRITSYNVCYTKLLRENFSCCRRPDC